MVQLSFVDHVVAQGKASLSRLSGRLQDEADEDQTCFDYEEYDYYEDRYIDDVRYALDAWNPIVLAPS
ncbi:MAG: hypothetical protein ACRD6W_16185 [Nitrososphaerales archaeon]